MIINIEEYILKEISYYLTSNVEYGGFIFGIISGNNIIIKSLSVKKGKMNRITIGKNDSKLLYSNYKIIGTWHIHQTFNEIELSLLDKRYYHELNEKYIHFIFNKKAKFKLYNKNGKELMYEVVL